MTALEVVTGAIEELFGVVGWDLGHQRPHAVIECPGAASHSNPGTTAWVYVEGAPTVSCQHTSCQSKIQEANHDLRSRVNADLRAAGLSTEMTAEQKLAWRVKRDEAAAKSRKTLRIECWAKSKLLPKIVDVYRRPLVELAAESPVPVIGTSPWRHKEMFLQALAPFGDERWFTGANAHDHGASKRWAKHNFRLVSELIEQPGLAGRHVAPADFCHTHIRTPCAVRQRKLMILELDGYSPDRELNKEVGVAVARYVAEENPEWGMRLFAVVDSGNKSTHCWFTWPDIGPEDYETFKHVMIGLGVDKAFDGVDHSFRMPGVMRLNGVPENELVENGKYGVHKKDELSWDYNWTECAWQKLVYLNPDAISNYDRLPSSLQTHGNTLNPILLAAKEKAREAQDYDDSTHYEQYSESPGMQILRAREDLE